MPTIFVVDDDDAICEALTMLFAGEGYTVVCAQSGVRALELLRAHREPAVVLFDYLMPHGDGLDLLTGVAGDKHLQRCYAFICMAARPRSRMPNAFNARLDQLAVTFVDKPFDVDHLLETVEDAHRNLVARLGLTASDASAVEAP